MVVKDKGKKVKCRFCGADENKFGCPFKWEHLRDNMIGEFDIQKYQRRQREKERFWQAFDNKIDLLVKLVILKIENEYGV